MSSIFDNLPQILKHKAYANVPFSMTRSQLEQAMDCFLAFLELPDSIKNHIDFRLSTIHRRGDIGFKHRDPKNSIYDDSKDFFHYHPQIHQKYEGFLKDNPVVESFMQAAKPVWDLVYETIQYNRFLSPSRKISQKFRQKFWEEIMIM